MRMVRGLVVAVLCVAMVGTSGCRTKGKKGAAGGDGIAPTAMEGDLALPERFEDGERITDVNFTSVYFAYDSYQIGSAELAKIEQVGTYMQENGRVRLIVEGHCDERGSSEYNLALGEHRALAIRAYLLGLGIDPARIQTRSYGEERPVDPGHGESSWRLNRRGEFALYK